MAEIVIVPSPEAAGVLVADEIVKLISERPDAVLRHGTAILGDRIVLARAT